MTDDLPGRFERPDPDGSFTMPDRYLGDGVIASFDGYQIWLSTDRDGITHRIALEPEVYDALHHYMQDIYFAAQNAQQQNATD
jgi:hypothetical protein